MAEKCPFCERVVEGYLTNFLENGSPACDDCIAKEAATQKEREKTFLKESTL